MPLDGLKISQMTLATTSEATDVFPIVRGPANFKTNRPTFLTAAAGESIGIVSTSAQIGISSSGNPSITAASGATLILAIGTTKVIYHDASGVTTIDSQPGQVLQLGADVDSNIKVNHSNGTLLSGITSHIVSGGQYLITRGSLQVVKITTAGDFIWNVPGGRNFQFNCNFGQFLCDASGIFNIQNGDGSSVILGYLPNNSADWSGDPTDLANAVDRLAAAVAGLLGGPIP